MIRFEDLVDKVRSYSPDADLELLRRAYVFSAREHKGQVRHSGEPYLVHPLEVANLLADMRLDAVAVAAGLLHDVVEDTLTTIERVAELFGPEVAHVVEGVTKLSSIPFSSREAQQAENFRRMFLAMVDDIRVILVKLADRLHNMRTLGHVPDEKRERIARETLDIYAPIANRLGMSKVKNELEELSFKALEPRAYEELRDKVDQRRRTTQGLIEELRGTILSKLEEAQVPVVSIDGRIKRLYSIYLKLHRQRIDLDQVYDLVALRVVTTSVKDCYAVLGIVHQTWQPVPERIKDFIAMPRPNGYQSLHTSVISDRGLPFEIQIRTEEMHRVAEEGIAAHWKYKEGRVGAQRDEQYFKWLRQLLEWQQDVRDPHEFIASLKIELYPEEIYCFTPGGELKELPRDATIVDFAYAVHTDVGHRCVGGRVNGKMAPLRHPLKNGDIVEILTQSGHKPSRDWLSFVKTSRARNKIRHFIQLEEKTRSVELGRKLFEKEARRYDINPKNIPAEAWQKVASESGSQKPDDLLAAVGWGKMTARLLLGKLMPAEELKEKAPDAGLFATVRKVLRPRAAGEDKIRVRGADDLLVFRARCCNPIKGEKIVGYITRGKGVSVHSASCRNVTNLMYDPERRIEVEWDSGDDPSAPYTVRLSIQVEDRRGMLAAISSQVSAINTNIRTMEATTVQEQGFIEMTVEIQDVKHLDKVIRAVKGLPGVLNVERHAGGTAEERAS
ncbi:bifunctional (p)ppGpp synthetase/guanosine-3',5'-bis(diphosphate) 3'-pyrophosphohydrolase [Luteitalea sp.]|uniref:RelA/SpoT family protein n=1 Tax=Luteitalea sp. TaxID=2004800 RepID=UPI000AC825E8|nr:bifunctional (p)ppGpp synthetase/guanosine-3',5'-bis(diphosphate) 3'-pyrophosphohydrolase [Luteitalea sp.]